jgi:hypothetical protein
MKVIAFLILIIGGSVCCFGQEIDFSKLTMSEILSFEFDTTYFANGKIETITRQTQFGRTLIHDREVMTVYQYDQCGNWRNTTTVYESNEPDTFEMESVRWRTEPKRWQVDKPAIGVICNAGWVKPVIY